MTEYLKSPFNYTGGKHKLLKQILPLFPKSIDNMVDLFSGGCNVGINTTANKITFIDHNDKLISLIQVFKDNPVNCILNSIEEIIDKYKLSDSAKYGYEYYGCTSSDGLGVYNNDKYLSLRSDYNNNDLCLSNYERNIMLYVLIIFGFNNQIRFNKSGGFNIPVGKRDFNKKNKTNLLLFLERIQNDNIIFRNTNFKELSLTDFENTFVYADPPYLITNASYNEQNGWTEKCEHDLYRLLDKLTENNIQFAISNVLENKGKENIILKEWIEKNQYTVHFMDKNYNNSNYQIKDRTKKTIEILITNY